MPNIPSLLLLAESFTHQLPDFPGGMDIKTDQIAGYIDHTLLKPDATPLQIEQLCNEARMHGFASVCVNSSYVSLAVSCLQGSGVPAGSTIGFPLGAMSAAAKQKEAEQALRDGAAELDMVLAIGMLRAKAYAAVYSDIQAVVMIAHEQNALVKVILETGCLTDDEKIVACLLAQDAGADFVKTSTGFGHGGATEADIKLMRSVVGPVEKMGVKASGGIRTLDECLLMIKAGATRIGSSSGVRIMQEMVALKNG